MKDLLLQPYLLTKGYALKNRILMAPMTRVMATPEGVPTLDMAAYYARRADAGLIITEGTLINAKAGGYPNVPGIYTETQVSGWKHVTEAVHARGGMIFSQLWHVGRVSHPNFLGGQLPLAPSATRMKGPVRRSPGLSYGMSRAASLNEIATLIKNYVAAAVNAMRAGFDGIELHGANGYLIDQFLHFHTNQREDAYGGSPENRARFALEIVDTIGENIGWEFVGIRLTPGAYMNEMACDESDRATFITLLEELNQRPIAYVHLGTFDDSPHYETLEGMRMSHFLRKYYHGTLIGNGGFSLEEARVAIERGHFDLLSIGTRFIANPDLIQKVSKGLPLREYLPEMLNTLD